MRQKAACLLAVISTYIPLMAMERVDARTAREDAQHNGTAKTQFEMKWSSILKSPYPSLLPFLKNPIPNLPPFEGPGILDVCKLMQADYLALSFTNKSSSMPEGRKKLIHGQGSVIGIKFVIRKGLKTDFSGILKDGAPYGIMRLSLRVPPEDDSCIPGIAFKFFSDGQEPADILALHSLEGIKGLNVLSQSFNTTVKEPGWSIKTWLFEKRFCEGAIAAGLQDPNPRSFSIDHLAKSKDSTDSRETSAPYGLIWKPTAAAANLLNNIKKGEDFRILLEGKGDGMTLFNVYTTGRNTDSPELMLGEIIAITAFRTSQYADEELFFSHPALHKMPPSSSIWDIFNEN
jgi:hypothetical protein